jgi:hypothetical protein
MHQTFVLIRRETQEIDGVVSTHLDDLDEFQYNNATHDLTIISPTHPILTDHHRNYAFRGGDIIRRSQIEIDVLTAADLRRLHNTPEPSDGELLLELVNELRVDKGLPAVTINDLRNKR